MVVRKYQKRNRGDEEEVETSLWKPEENRGRCPKMGYQTRMRTK